MKNQLLVGAAMVAAFSYAEELSPIAKFFERVEPHTLIEVIGSSAERGGVRENEIILDKVELSLEGEVDENVSFGIVGLYENGEDVTIDSAEIAYSLPLSDVSSLSFSGGLIYLPFGSYESFFISDPLTLELGEISDGSLGVAYENEFASLSAFIFDGNIDAVNEDEGDDLFYVAALAVKPADWLEFRASFISGILNAGFADAVNEAVAAGEGYDDAAGINFAVVAALYDFTLSGEYVGAADDVSVGDASFRPAAWTIELGCNFTDDLLCAVRYERSSDFEDMPSESYGVVSSYSISEYLSVSAEYLRNEYENDDDGDQFTVCFALEY